MIKFLSRFKGPKRLRLFLAGIATRHIEETYIANWDQELLEDTRYQSIISNGALDEETRAEMLKIYIKPANIHIDEGIPVIRLVELILALRNNKVFPPVQPKHVEPPSIAESLICLLLPRDEREEVIGSMVECFNRDIAKYGVKKARWYFWMETVREVYPFAKRFLTAFVRGGGVAWLGHIIHRFTS